MKIIKHFPTIGEVEYKIASTREELEQAAGLVYQEYLRRGFIQPKYYKSPMRLTLHQALPHTATFIAVTRPDNKVIATVTLIPDTPLGLPMDTRHQKELAPLRRAGRQLCEVGLFATDTSLMGRPLFSTFNFKKFEFIISLFNLLFQYALYHAKFDDLCIVVSPKAFLFNFLFFEPLGKKVSYYGFDRTSIKKKPAIAKRLDLRTIHERVKRKPRLDKLFFGERLPAQVLTPSLTLSPTDLRELFVKKSDVFEQATPAQLSCLQVYHQLSDEEFQRMLLQQINCYVLPAVTLRSG